MRSGEAKGRALSEAGRLIRYLRDCRQADSRELAVTNLLGATVEHCRFLSGREEILDGTLSRLPVDPAWAGPVEKAAAVYRRERCLIYACFLLVAPRFEMGGRERALCAPLLFYPAAVEHEQAGREALAFVRPDLAEPRYNVPVLGALLGGEESATGALEGLLAALPEPPLDAGAIHNLAALVESLLVSVDAGALYRYPGLAGEDEVREALQAPAAADSRPVRLLPAAALAFIENPPETRGILFELSDLSDRSDPGPPLRSLLLGERPARSGRGCRVRASHVPAVLSAPQQQALDSAAFQAITLVIGPPGTGKTFTAAAIALSHLYRGESVLFAARASQALDVIADKLDAMLGESGFVIRAGRGEYLKELKEYLENLLRGALPLESCRTEDLGRAERRLRRLTRGIIALERALERHARSEQALGEVLSGPAGREPSEVLFDPLRRRFLEWRLNRAGKAWDLMARYQALVDERVRLLSLILKIRMRGHLEKALARHREDLKVFLQALKARTSSRQERLFGDLDLRVLLKAFPVWMAGISDLHRALPLSPGLFDLTVIDEATQCDMASCLPVLYRARRVVATGDPKQLRHVSFLSRARQAGIADRHNVSEDERLRLEYRERSLLDLVEDAAGSAGQIVLLDEHYRSRPRIIEFSNREFYGGRLKVMTQSPGSEREPCLTVCRVDGRREPAGPNREEARALVEAVGRMVEAEEPLDRRLCRSIGVLSPFREQVDLLQRLLPKRLSSAAIGRHDLRIGTAHSFQGEERDVMFLSFVVDRDANGQTFRYLNRPDVFNVSVTRARGRQVVFASLAPEEAPAGSLLARYLADAGSAVPSAPQESLAPRDPFLQEVRKGLEAHGLQAFPAFPVAGLVLDLVAERNGRFLGIDLIGCPGSFAAAFPLERYRMLQRAGIPVVPIPYSEWRRDAAACLAAVLARL